MRNPPQITHSGTGQFTITNANPSADYALFTTSGNLVNGASYANGVINFGGNFGNYKISYVSQPTKGTPVSRARITYRTETTTSCNDNCGLAYQCPGFGDGVGCRPCWGYGNDGTFAGGVCCGGSRGQTCSTSSRQVKNGVPSGYTERYGEWVKITNPESTRAVEEKDTGLFTLPKVEWEEDYYTAVQMPVPHQAQVINEDTGEPTGELLENVPAWDYDAVYFIHYNLDGDVVWMKDYINDPECFLVVQKSLMNEYEMWVSNLPPAYEGTYEFVIANSEEEFVREEGIV